MPLALFISQRVTYSSILTSHLLCANIPLSSPVLSPTYLAAVERLFSRLRILDGERRARAADEVLADELFIVGNADYTDKLR